MTAYLPYPDFVESAGVLDDRLLGRQRHNIIKILDVLHKIVENPVKENDPSVRMWDMYEVALCEYGLITCEEYKARGFKDNLISKIETHLDWATSGNFLMEKPPWWGNQAVHLSHQSHLIRFDPAYYGPKFPGVPNDLPMFWPVS